MTGLTSLFNFFSSTNNKNELTSSSPESNSSSNKSEPVWVYTWDLVAGKTVGHSAIQVGGDKPKQTDNDEGKYMSIWPRNVPSVGPLVIVPLQAATATNLRADSEAQGTHSNFPDFNDQTTISVEEKNISPPSHVYRVDGLDTQSIKHEMERVEKEIENGSHSYQLLPNIGLFNRRASVSAETNLAVSENKKESSEFNRSNCTTLVEHMLEAGGAPIDRSYSYPWGITPNGLSEEVKSLEGANDMSESFKSTLNFGM